MRTVENANHLVFLKDGLNKEEGTHSELLKLNGLYANMIRLQKESSKWNVK